MPLQKFTQAVNFLKALLLAREGAWSFALFGKHAFLGGFFFGRREWGLGVAYNALAMT
jgi:hypothetical protein